MLAIRYLVDQVVLGVVLNLLVLGLTSFLYTQVMQTNAAGFNSSPPLPTWNDPGAVQDPDHRSGAVRAATSSCSWRSSWSSASTSALFHTRWGLRTRAVGEHPTAADTVGIKVLATRYRNVLIAGVIAGLGGAYFTIGLGNDFSKNMTVGKGFIALAALIFGRWSPIGATLAALLFGFADQLAELPRRDRLVDPDRSSWPCCRTSVTILAVAGSGRAGPSAGRRRQAVHEGLSLRRHRVAAT